MRQRLILSLCLSLSGIFSSLAAAKDQAPAIQASGLGRGLVHLNQPWQFHLGDDLQWAKQEIDDASGQGGWESISPDRPWGAQGHYAYTGFAWYRLHIDIATSMDRNSEIRLVLPGIEDTCELYWNGTLIGRYGELPPYPSWPVVDEPAVFTLPRPYTGTLSLRFWKAGLGSSSSGEVGGLTEAPIIGDAESVRNYIDSWNYGFLRGTLFSNALNVLYLINGVVAFILWLRRRSEWLLLWFSIFAICPAIWNSISTMRLDVSSQFAGFVIQPLWQIRNVALWFLLIDLLGLRSRLSLVRWARFLSVISIAAAFFDGCLSYVPPAWMTSDTGAWIDGILTCVIAPCTLFLLVIAAYGFRKKHDSVRWLVAVSASLSQLLAVVAAMAQQGQRFTHWTLAQKLYSPLFHIGPAYFSVQTLVDLLVFFSVLYAVYRFAYNQQTRNAILEQELQSARELQKVLIPESTPELPGYTISSAYNPALEVGGDFFQIIPLQGENAGSTLVVLGDVSGKGLRAAMAVSLIVGSVRTLAENTSSPSRILQGLSRRLYGRLQGGFTTCLALRLDSDGLCTLASAGHPAPYLNDREINIPGALPLGIDPSVEYREITLQIHPKERVTLYTDGLLEARSASGEIFSFNRLQSLVAESPSAASATAAAIAFGQEDDITVLTVTRSA
jgi:hypothetical protein